MTIQQRRFAWALAALLLVGSGWWAWRWYTTPAPPELSLDHMDPAVADAVQTALDEVRREPRSGAAWGRLALVMAANSHRDQALEFFSQAERLDSQDPRWPYLRGHMLLSGDRREALAALQRALQRADSAERRAQIHFRLAMALFDDGAFADAEQHLQALQKLESESPRVRYGLGLLAVVRNDRRAVHEHMESLLDSPFARKSANGHLAAVAQAEGDEAQARIYQQRAAQLPSDLDWPDPFLLEMNGHEVGRRNRILEAERLEGRGQLREAVAILRQIAADTPDIRSFVTLGLGLGKLGAYDEAEQVLLAALRIDAGNSQANYALGAVLLMNGEQHLGTPEDREPAHDLFRKAIAAQDRVLAVQPDHGMAHLMRGRALQRLGRADAAIQALREAVLCRPELADAHRYLGEALAEAGQLSEGLTHLEDAVRLAAPNDPGPRQALERWRAKAKSSS